MKPIALLTTSTALAVAASLAVQLIPRPADSGSSTSAVAPDADREALRSMAREIERLDAELRAVRELASSAPLAARSPEIDLDALVREAVRTELDAAGAHAALSGTTGPARAAAPAPDASDLLAELSAPGLGQQESQAIWRRASEAGLTNALVELLEQRAAERPSDPKAQLQVGNAYLQKLFEVSDGPERGLWATRADQAFDRALELDPRHWEARFTKAVSLSFWPPLFGKQAEAIRHFEVLVEQQKSLPLAPQHAQTYELLGNLYQQSGKAERALEIWRAGAALFPQVESLASKAQGPGPGN